MFSIFWPFKLVLGILKFFFNLVVFASCVLTLMAMMGDKGWIWSLTTHFRMQYLCLQMLALLLSCLALLPGNNKNKGSVETWVSVSVLGIFTALNLSRIAPYYLPLGGQGNITAASDASIKLMHLNLFGKINHNSQSVLKAIEQENPDLIDLVEYTETWRAQLENTKLFQHYPYRISGQDNIALYSKRPLWNAHISYAASQHPTANQANIIAQLKLNKKNITLLVAHPASPILPSHLEWLKESFHGWEKERNRLGKNLILVGDLNTSPWSVEFSELLRQTGLRDSQTGFGIQPSWPMLLPILGITKAPSVFTNLFGIPIDHVLVSDKIMVLSRHTGPFVGSDHLPVVAVLGIQP